MIFWRVFDNKLYNVGEVKKLGFEENENLRIPDDYLENKEFNSGEHCFHYFKF